MTPHDLPHRPPSGPERKAAERLDRALFGPLGSDPYGDMARAWSRLAWLAAAFAVITVAAFAWAVAALV